jgi:integrase
VVKTLTKLGLDALTEPGRYLAGGVPGLYVQVTIGKDGQPRRSFVFRYKFQGRAREAGLGAYPAVSLAEARDRAREGAALKAKGVDPLEAKAKSKADASILKWNFAEASEEFLRHVCEQKANSKFPLRTVRQWRSALARFVYPKIGKLDCREIRYEHLTAILAPLTVAKGKTKRAAVGGPTVAARLRSRIERILDFAAVSGRRDANLPNVARPQLFKDVLGTAPKVAHHPAPPLDDAPGLYQRIAAEPGTIYRAVQFLILTAARLRETLDARFEEIDLEARTWKIPESRSKMGRPHIVPLSKAASEVIEAQRQVRCSDFIFPGRFGSPVASSTIAPAMRRIGIGPDVTNHGWRSVCRDAMADRLDIDHETAEFVLAHVKGGVEGAYRRETAIAKRRVAMERYADWLCGREPASNVVPLRTATA